MSVLIIGSYVPDAYDQLTVEERAIGKRAARHIFGYEQLKSEEEEYEDSKQEGEPVDEMPEIVRYKPITGIRFLHVDSFRRSQPGDTQIGWMAIISDGTYRKFVDEIKWPNGPLCHIFDLQIIALEDDPDTYAVYKHMTPAHWGPPSS